MGSSVSRRAEEAGSDRRRPLLVSRGGAPCRTATWTALQQYVWGVWEGGGCWVQIRQDDLGGDQV